MFHRQISAVGPNRITQVVSPLQNLMTHLAVSTKAILAQATCRCGVSLAISSGEME